MQSSVLQGILLPFWGTSLGAACVFCLQRAPSAVLRRVLEGFAAGVMTAASVWSLLLPAIDWADMNLYNVCFTFSRALVTIGAEKTRSARRIIYTTPPRRCQQQIDLRYKHLVISLVFSVLLLFSLNAILVLMKEA